MGRVLKGRGSETVRVSFAALLKVKQDERHVLFRALNRPESYGPPGGVFKYFGPAGRFLEEMGFREDRIDTLAGVMKADLRGFLPASSMRDFLSWFASGAYREDSVECLRRELAEELCEVGLDHLEPSAQRLAFSHLRTVVAGPDEVPGQPYSQLRRFEVYELTGADLATEAFRRELSAAGADPDVPTVISATAGEIRYGRCGGAQISGQSAYLLGSQRYLADVPPVR
ncbi:SMODS-associated NUDIX domain-containing protein [Actinomadura terrae]|uniref:SMODS-associated NUDIX domain-containing protein n=1 Tax=Actinomadura terrae TaxID=604353 RepID=UPI001FA7CE68|nr:hypothetical protein [Actinomadura terrae]